MTSSSRTQPGSSGARRLDEERRRRGGVLKEQQAVEFPLVYRKGRIALQIAPESRKYLKVIPGAGLFLDIAAADEDVT